MTNKNNSRSLKLSAESVNKKEAKTSLQFGFIILKVNKGTKESFPGEGIDNCGVTIEKASLMLSNLAFVFGGTWKNSLPRTSVAKQDHVKRMQSLDSLVPVHIITIEC